MMAQRGSILLVANRTPSKARGLGLPVTHVEAEAVPPALPREALGTHAA